MMLSSRIIFLFNLLTYSYSPFKCNSNDIHIWNTTGKLHFNNDMQSCSTKCWGASKCVSNCIREKEHYSEECCDCFGNLASCTAKYCMTQCLKNETSTDCYLCVKSNCQSPFVNCSGIEPPQ